MKISSHRCGSCVFYDILSKDKSCMKHEIHIEAFDVSCAEYIPFNRHTSRTYEEDIRYAKSLLKNNS